MSTFSKIPFGEDSEVPESLPVRRISGYKTVRKSFTLPEPVANDLENLAESYDLSVSQTITRSVENQVYFSEIINDGGQVFVRVGDKIYPYDV